MIGKFGTAALLFIIAGASARAQTTMQTVTFQVDAVNRIGVTGAAILHITTATAGSAPRSVTSANTWAVTTNQSGAKVTASIPSNMPAGLLLSANLAAPSGAVSAGLTALSTTAVDLVTAISHTNASGLPLTYQLDAAAAVGAIGSSSVLVTFTITGGI